MNNEWTNSYGEAESVAEAGQWNVSKDELECTFPSDDHNTLQQLASGTANLDMYYNNHFQNEAHDYEGIGLFSNYQIAHTPILKGTMTGTILLLNQTDLGGVWNVIQTFVISTYGVCTFMDVGMPEVKATGCGLNCDTGELTFNWNSNPGKNRIIVNYETSAEQTWTGKKYTTNDSGAIDVGEDECGETEESYFTRPKVAKKSSHWTIQQSPDQNTTSYIDYLVNQLSEVKSKLYDAEEKLKLYGLDVSLKSIPEDFNEVPAQKPTSQPAVNEKALVDLEMEMADEYDKKLKQQREYMVDKLDEFLRMNDEGRMPSLKSRTTVEIFEEAMEGKWEKES